MDELYVTVCSGCGSLRALLVPPATGAACPVCTGVDTQQRVAIIITNLEIAEGTDTVAVVKLLP